MAGTTAAAVLLIGVRLVNARRSVAPPAPASIEGGAPAPPRRAAAPPIFRPQERAPTARRAHADELAHLRGRLIVPAGALLEEPPRVVADDGQREYQAETTAEGHFELHLPARAYTIAVQAGTLVGLQPIDARPGVTEVSIALAESVAIAGTIRPIGPETPEITVTRAGSTLRVGAWATDGGSFTIHGLHPGALYDLTFDRAGHRTRVLRGIAAPTSALAVALDELPSLRGAIGYPPGGRCPFRDIEIGAFGADSFQGYPVDQNCRFEILELPAAPEVTLRASARGWHVEARVLVPEHGQPEAVCINPPCHDRPLLEAPWVEVVLTGAPPDTEFDASMSGRHGRACGPRASNTCRILNVTPGEDRVMMSSPTCDRAHVEVTIEPGRNEVRIPCTRTREVQGTLRAAQGPGGTAPGSAAVRCPGGEAILLTGTHVFSLQCSADQNQVEYRTAGERTWRTAPLAPHVDPVLVELRL